MKAIRWKFFEEKEIETKVIIIIDHTKGRKVKNSRAGASMGRANSG